MLRQPVCAILTSGRCSPHVPPMKSTPVYRRHASSTLFGLGLVLALSHFGARAAGSGIRGITVRNAQLKVTKELRTRAELDEFERHWSSRTAVKVDEEARDWQLTLDLLGRQGGERWLYQTNGLLMRVSDATQTVYRVRNAGALNVLLGAPRY